MTGRADFDRYPIDPDVDVAEDIRHHRGGPPVAAPSRWPRLRAAVLAAVFVGGCAGGLLRYGASEVWPSGSFSFPWATFGVNVAGAFVLAVIVVVATDVTRSPAVLRPLLGTGFCGALTTFSSLVVSAARLFAHSHARTAVAYLALSLVAGLAAGFTGLVLARAIVGRTATGENVEVA
jgi:CrcB protein